MLPIVFDHTHHAFKLDGTIIGWLRPADRTLETGLPGDRYMAVHGGWEVSNLAGVQLYWGLHQGDAIAMGAHLLRQEGRAA